MDAAVDRLAGLAEPRLARVHPWIALRSVPDLVEAASRSDRKAEVAAPLERFTAWAEQTGSAWGLAAAARCQGLLAHGTDSEARLLQALRLHADSDSPFHRARTQLCLGEALRRGRKRVEARAHLRAAEETFEQLGVRPWAARARIELDASGETVRRRDPSALADLTPQELQIARLVGQGAINRDIAAQLFLSPKTVEYHLHKVFQKLGIKSRTELSGLAADGELPFAAAGLAPPGRAAP